MRGLFWAMMACAGTAQADIIITFQDGAPKDRFTLTNTSDCATGPFDVTLDLGKAPAGLIFDVTGTGAGVEVYQPFELTSGEQAVVGVSDIQDGDQSMTLSLSDMAPGGQIAFTIDLDDTGGGREITVSGAEIAGAMVVVSSDLAVAEGAFDDAGAARVLLSSCTA